MHQTQRERRHDVRVRPVLVVLRARTRWGDVLKLSVRFERGESLLLGESGGERGVVDERGLRMRVSSGEQHEIGWELRLSRDWDGGLRERVWGGVFAAAAERSGDATAGAGFTSADSGVAAADSGVAATAVCTGVTTATERPGIATATVFTGGSTTTVYTGVATATKRPGVFAATERSDVSTSEHSGVSTSFSSGAAGAAID